MQAEKTPRKLTPHQRQEALQRLADGEAQERERIPGKKASTGCDRMAEKAGKRA